MANGYVIVCFFVLICNSVEGLCVQGGITYQEGKLWSASTCSSCRCQQGRVLCGSQPGCQFLGNLCQQMLPGHDLTLCPDQPKKHCLWNRKVQASGSVWKPSLCNLCICSDGKPECYFRKCNSTTTCGQGSVLVTRDDDCCATCVPPQNSCKNGSRGAEIQDWSWNSCGTCPCSEGRLLCRLLSCSTSQRTDPLCGAQTGATWFLDNCTLCECVSGEIRCYTKECPLCPKNTTQVLETGSCCPSCREVLCHKSCRTCLDYDPSYCTSCLDKTSVLQNGLCTDQCDRHHFKDAANICQECHPSCGECWGLEAGHCLTCPVGLYRLGGFCLGHCGPGRYSDSSSGLCNRCDPSCSQCQGSSPDQCLGCASPYQYLENGRCVDRCGAKYYTDGSVCKACHSSCKICVHDGPGCLTCLTGFYLHGGQCTSSCPPGFFPDEESARCIKTWSAQRGCECDANCKDCIGPLRTHCSDCPDGKILQDGLCVAHCGRGFFKETTLFKCSECHESCERCLGPSDNHCTSCSRSDLFFLRLSESGQSGRCLNECPSGHYLHPDGRCQKCWPGCLECWNENENGCLRCSSPRLLQNGGCVLSCARDEYQESGECHRCHPTCDTCKAWGDKNCTSCLAPTSEITASGRCLSPCPAGQFSTLPNKCARCEDSCSQCVRNSRSPSGSSLCVTCNSEAFPQLDRCVSRCHQSFYLDRHRMCRRCDSSCLTCDSAGPLSCTSCSSGLYLSSSGQCVPSCPFGTYSTDGHCQDCEEGCLQCQGPEGRCVLCDAKTALVDGKCLIRCPRRMFLNSNTSECSGCSVSCDECFGSGTDNCLACRNELVLHRGRCVVLCPPGHYKYRQQCRACLPGCSRCQNKSECSDCVWPKVLWLGECVNTCGKATYLDHTIRTCKDCPDNCTVCGNEEGCLFCSPGFFNEEGKCQEECSQGSRPDKFKRICLVNQELPQLQVLGPLVVSYGGRTSIDGSIVRVAASDGRNLTFTLTGNELCGEVVKQEDDGREQVLGSNSQISMEDLDFGRVVYRHKGCKNLTGRLNLRFCEGQRCGNETTLSVQTISVKPMWRQFRPVSVQSGSLVTITPSDVELEDQDNFKDVSLTLLTEPTLGVLRIGNGPSARELKHKSVFTGQNLANFQVSYAPLAGLTKTSQDKILLQVTDGFTVIPVQLLFTVTSQQLRHPSVWPVVVRKTVAKVPRGGMLKISNQLLEVVDRITRPDKLIISLKTNPKHGRIVKLEVSRDKWWSGDEQLRDGSAPLPAVASFTQKEINSGNIWYQNSGHPADKDDFRFNVLNLENPRSDIPPDDDFPIVIVPRPEDKTIIRGSSHNTGLTASPSEEVVLTSKLLSHHWEKDQDPAQIIYVVTEPLGPNEGLLYRKDRPGEHIATFSQKDVDQGLIRYKAPNYQQGLNEESEYRFHFTVKSVGLAGETIGLPEQSFVIHLSSEASASPRLLRTVLKIDRGGSAVVLPTSETKRLLNGFTLLHSPRHGVLQLKVKNVTERVDEGRNLTLNQDASQVTYNHDGSNSSEDKMVFSIRDGTVPSTFSVDVQVISKEVRRQPMAASTRLQTADYRTPLSSSDQADHEFQITAGDRSDINRNHLAYRDSSRDDSHVTYTLTRAPSLVRLVHQPPSGREVTLAAGDTFTQRNINQGEMKISATSMNKSADDNFVFSVTDGTGNFLVNQTVKIRILATLPETPTLQVLRKLQVKEGGYVVIDESVLNTSVTSESLNELLLKVDLPPKSGYLKHSTLGKSEQFTWSDMVQGLVSYVQKDHLGKEPDGDLFSLYLTGSGLTSLPATLEVSIALVNDEPPTVVSEPVTVVSGANVVINDDSFLVWDMDTPAEELTVSVQTLPRHGGLWLVDNGQKAEENKKRLGLGDSFQYLEIRHGRLVYTHEGESEYDGWDRFTLQVSDGELTVSKDLQVHLLRGDVETPRLLLNRGLTMEPDTSAVIDSAVLRATDLDSKDHSLEFVLTSDPPSGRLVLLSSAKGAGGEEQVLRSAGPSRSFTQEDLDAGRLRFVHRLGEKTGNIVFRFRVSDPARNALIEQAFVVNVKEDRNPPRLVAKKPLVIQEGAWAPITEQNLLFMDQEREPRFLVFKVDVPPKLGHLALTDGASVTEFTQADVEAGRLGYKQKVRLGPGPATDSFAFTLTDGTHKIMQTFDLVLEAVDNEIPILKIGNFSLQIGRQKTISEFDLLATDTDTKDENLTFCVVKNPGHGSLILEGNQQTDGVVRTFTMLDVLDGRVTYKHDGSRTNSDSFLLTLSDGSTSLYGLQTNQGVTNISTNQPTVFHVAVVPGRDIAPVPKRNEGLHLSLDLKRNRAVAIIKSQELLYEHLNTPARLIIYTLTTKPSLGDLVIAGNLTNLVTTFSQEDLDSASIWYVLRPEARNRDTTRDHFTFSVRARDQNASGVFHIQWSKIFFTQKVVRINEQTGQVRVQVRRTGSLEAPDFVRCTLQTNQTRSVEKDIIVVTDKAKFDKDQEVAFCELRVLDDSVYEGEENVTVRISDPSRALLGNQDTLLITIQDFEDEPRIEFDKDKLYVKESDDYVKAPVIRRGDTSGPQTFICYTSSLSAKGATDVSATDLSADYLSRPYNHQSSITFQPGTNRTTCDVMILNDSAFEEEEEFDIVLTDLSKARRKSTTSARTTCRIVIAGPNDVPEVQFDNTSVTVTEDVGVYHLLLKRMGPDLSHPCALWCSPRQMSPPSAKVGEDFLSTAVRVTFASGQDRTFCPVTVLDDMERPLLEGLETFQVTLNDSTNCTIAESFSLASVVINDTFLDVPEVRFTVPEVRAQENQGKVSIPVERVGGDLSVSLTLAVFTESGTAKAGQDYKQLRNSLLNVPPDTQLFRIEVDLVDDYIFEGPEQFTVELAWIKIIEGSVRQLGLKVDVIILDEEDAPTVLFENTNLTLNDPPGSQPHPIPIRVLRTGDCSRSSSVRVSTRDGSALAGKDYLTYSQVLHFLPDERSKDVTVQLLGNSAGADLPRLFWVILDTRDLVGARLGSPATIPVHILPRRRTAAGAPVFPAPPIVMTLPNYESNKTVDENFSTGHSLVCVTACDPRHPDYQATSQSHCQGITDSGTIFDWETTLAEENGARGPFQRVQDDTPFTRAHVKMLDPVYFGSHVIVRCLARPLDTDGQLGVQSSSLPVTISSSHSECGMSNVQGVTSFHVNPFRASLRYLNASDFRHPNKIQIHIEIPHHDGMIPLVSTTPLHDARSLLTDPVSRQQHPCSNMAVESITSQGEMSNGFLDLNVRNGSTANLDDLATSFFRHLDTKRCLWTFDAFYHITDLTDLCGGRVLSGFQSREGGRVHLTVRLPVFVSEVRVFSGWTQLEQRTELQLSFYYSSVLWRTGLRTHDLSRSVKVQLVRLTTDFQGRLVIEFRTQAQFRGILVKSDWFNPEVQSRVVAPTHLGLTFDLILVWSEKTFDGPRQFWRAISNFSLRDYSGNYTLELIPCTVDHEALFDVNKNPLTDCRLHPPERFPLSIAYQQSSLPIPVVYSLNTIFQILNNKQHFLSDPEEMSLNLVEMDFTGSFAKSETVYGRVLWNPEQGLDSAYRLRVEQVYLCSGREGYLPTYDPTGKIYGQGPQFGCIRPHSSLAHRFLVLDRQDRQDPKSGSKPFLGAGFQAMFAEQSSDLRTLDSLPGVDGFCFNVDPLYQIHSGQQWHVQVSYTIQMSGRKFKRSSISSLPSIPKNGTNIHSLLLVEDQQGGREKGSSIYSTTWVTTSLCALLAMLCVLLLFACWKKRRAQWPYTSSCFERNSQHQDCVLINSALLGDTDFARTMEVTARGNLSESTEV